MLRPLAASVAVILSLLLAGCSGSEEPAAEPASSSGAVDTLVSQGISQLDGGDTAAARTTFQNVLGLDPANPYAHYNLGYIAQLAGDATTAMSEYDAALATDPAFGSALYNKAILTEPTDLDAAVGLYRQAVAVQPDLAAAHMRLGFALLHLGQKSEGEKELGEGIQLDPSMKDVEPPTYE